ncbi:NAD(P)/FAD-dependent oxidoreductase [Gordonia sp. VNK21]|uniref:NAD(P)/FAD-dependent oxidoreductase n=1 Tax=Gordonia sp. VNK21 TaxID=3382483 RepID=UPI0038D4966D
MSDAVVIVGAGLGGLRLAEHLRSKEFDGPVVLIGDEPHPPYDRPPLSKAALTDGGDRPDLKPAEFYTDAQIDLRTGTRVVAVDPAAHTVTTEHDGTTGELSYGTLVLATGLVARAFPGEGGDLSGVHVIRSVDQAQALRRDLDGASRAVVIGAGFIGCEAAASLRTLGIEVALIEPEPVPLAAALGAQIGERVTRLHTEAGVDLRTGVTVSRITGENGRVTGVELSDGAHLAADVVVVGIGGYPELGYLDGSGIELADRATGGGIACDDLGRTSAPDVYAVGDAANWADADGNRHRAEHWNHTVDQAVIVAAQILGQDRPPASVPYFWSDQYDLKIQMLGRPAAGDEVHLVDDDGRKFLAYYSRDGVLTAVVGAGRVGKLMKTRAHLMKPTPITDLL